MSRAFLLRVTGSVVIALVLVSGFILTLQARPQGSARPMPSPGAPLSSPRAPPKPPPGPSPRLVVQTAVVQTSFVGFSADAKHLVSTHATDEGELVSTRIWEIESGLEVQRFDEYCAGLTKDRRAALLVSPDRLARLVTIPEGIEKRRLQLDRRSWPVSASPDADALLVRRDRGGGLAWIDFATGAERPVAIDSSFRIGPLSPASGVLLATDRDSKAVALDAASGQVWTRFDSGAGRISQLAFSPDGRLAAGCTVNHLPGGGTPAEGEPRLGWVYVWDVATGGLVQKLDYEAGEPAMLVFTPDSLGVLGPGRDGVARLWDLRTGGLVGRYETGGYTLAAGFSADGRTLATSPQTRTLDDAIQLWDVATGTRAQRLEGHAEGAVSASFEAKGRLLAVLGRGVRFWDLERGEETRRFAGAELVRDRGRPTVSPDGRFLASTGRGVGVFDVATGKAVWQTEGQGVQAAAFSADGRLLAAGSGGTIELRASDSPAVLRTLVANVDVQRPDTISALVFSTDGRFLVAAGGVSVRTFDLLAGKEVYRIGLAEGESPRLSGTSVAVSPDGRFGLSSMSGVRVVLWELETGREVRQFPQEHSVSGVAFSPDSRLALIYERRTGGTRLVDVATGQDVRRFEGVSMLSERPFSPDGRFLVTQAVDGSTRIWNVATGEEVVRLVSFKDGTWAAIDMEGRFDGSNGGDVEGMHWVVGLQPVALRQLKQRYYDPGLLAKHLGTSRDPLRAVSGWVAPELFPSVEAAFSHAGSPDLTVRLTNRGGGIGRVSVAINGKEVTADARSPGADPNAAELRLSLRLEGNAYFIPGQPNPVEVRAYNSDGYMSSRSVSLVYEPPAAGKVDVTLWAVVAGVSDYEGRSIDLRYAAKDARDMEKALSLGARRLFGVDHVRTTVLTTEADDRLPTKANLEAAFAQLADARPSDVLVVYLAGHGVAYGDEYYFLSADAASAELADPALRKAAVSADELVTWLRRSPASKQVMVLDTCAAGQAAARLVERREISSDQIRAIERLKDRTGFHVLMGSAADAVSYEASPYSQGLLTYALLQGMRGAALRDGEFVDVSTLFQYAADEVPELARDVGGIQRPRIAAPKGVSFDIGQLVAEDRPAVPLATPKPMLLRPYLQSSDDRFDTLALSDLLREKLRLLSHASRGSSGGPQVVYIDADQFAGAIRPSGDYAVRDGSLKATVVLILDGKKVGQFEAMGRAEQLDVVAEDIVGRIVAAARDR